MDDAVIVRTIHGHYLDLLRKQAELLFGQFSYSYGENGHTITITDGKGKDVLCVNEPTLHEALAAAMEAAFGEQA